MQLNGTYMRRSTDAEVKSSGLADAFDVGRSLDQGFLTDPSSGVVVLWDRKWGTYGVDWNWSPESGWKRRA